MHSSIVSAKLYIPLLQYLRVFLVATSLLPVAGFAGVVTPPYEIGTWQGFRTAAISYTFDDNVTNQYAIAVPMFNEKGFKLTLFTIVNSLPGGSWSLIKNAAEAGHEIASHTVTHRNLSTLSGEEQLAELQDSRNSINANVTNQSCVTLAYPFCVASDPALTSPYYIAARTCSGQIVPSTPPNFLTISSFICGALGSVQTLQHFTNTAENAASANGWAVYLIHGIDNDGGYSPLPSATLQESVDFFSTNQNRFWVQTFGNVVRYIRERNSASVSQTFSGDDRITLQVTDTLANSIYNFPITLRRPLPTNWVSATVFQNNSPVPTQIITTNSTNYVVFDVVPDAGEVMISNTMPPILITSQPASLSQVVGSTATFSVTASGSEPLMYQWWRNSAPIPGATESAYTRTNVQCADAGNYFVSITNSEGNATSLAAALAVAAVPSIVSQPTNTQVTEGEAALFSVTATAGCGGLSYQWQFNGTNISGATASSYTRVSAQAAHAGDYSVIVTNVAGSVTSSVATLSVDIPARLLLFTEGVGTLLPTATKYGTPTNGALLRIGTNYTITALAPSNHVFSNWVAIVSGITNATPTNRLTFTFESNLVLIATFTTNRFYDAGGTYNGLFRETGAVAYSSAGFAVVKVTPLSGRPARFSGALFLAGERLSLSGVFDAAGDGVNVKPIISKADPTTSYTVRLHLPFDDSDMLTGSVSNNSGAWVSSFVADRDRAASNYAGQYTMILPGDADPAVAPGGNGFGVVSINTNGVIKLAGALGDATVAKQTVPVSKNGDWPLFTPVYKGTRNGVKVTTGILFGWMTLTNGLEGSLSLIKTPNPGLYPDGFTNTFLPLTSPYTNSALSTNRVIELTSGSNGVVYFSGGNLALDITNKLRLSTLNKFAVSPTNTAGQINKLSLSLATRTGKINGNFKPDGVTAQKIAGAVLQHANRAGGFFLSPTNSGAFLLEGD